MPTGSPYPWYLTSESLDDPHKRIIDFVGSFRQGKVEWGPTCDEIGAALGINKATSRQMVDRLLRSGYLVKPGGKSRMFARTLRVSTDAERRKALTEGWVFKIRGLPKEEMQAALLAAETVRQEGRTFGDGFLSVREEPETKEAVP